MRQSTHRAEPVVSDSLTEYLNGIGRYRILTHREEAALGHRIRAGDVDAVNELVCANLRFVVSIAKQYQREDVALLDLIDEGNIGLIRAARRFDETRGMRFISYAVWWIRQSILQAAIAESQIVHVPNRRAATLRRIGRRANSLFQELGREPKQNEIAEELHISEQEVASAMSLSRVHLSLDASLPGEDASLLDYVPDDGTPAPDEEALEESRVAAVAQALSRLRPRDASILRMHFGFDGGDPMTLEEIGSRLGITRERVRQIRDRALRTLRKTMPDLALAG